MLNLPTPMPNRYSSDFHPFGNFKIKFFRYQTPSYNYIFEIKFYSEELLEVFSIKLGSKEDIAMFYIDLYIFIYGCTNIDVALPMSNTTEIVGMVGNNYPEQGLMELIFIKRNILDQECSIKVKGDLESFGNFFGLMYFNLLIDIVDDSFFEYVEGYV